MTGSLYEVVPNISEGRDAAIVDRCAAAVASAGARVVDYSRDPVHNRAVITALGSATEVIAGAVALARIACATIDLRHHTGAHPRIGALDVLPFVPLGGATLADAVTVAERAASRIWEETGIPSFLYGAAARADHRALLANVRRGEFEGLGARIADPRWSFDFGDRPHPRAGAIAIGARDILIAFNIELETADLRIAQRIARRLRERNGGLRTLRALGVRLTAQRVQVSCNITDHVATPLHRVRELVRRMAVREGVDIGRSELIGLAPAAAIVRAARAYAARDEATRPPV